VAFLRESLPHHLKDAYQYAQDLAYDISRIRNELGYKEIVSVMKHCGKSLRRCEKIRVQSTVYSTTTPLKTWP